MRIGRKLHFLSGDLCLRALSFGSLIYTYLQRNRRYIMVNESKQILGGSSSFKQQFTNCIKLILDVK